jgi:hypothetical protein
MDEQGVVVATNINENDPVDEIAQIIRLLTRIDSNVERLHTRFTPTEETISDMALVFGHFKNSVCSPSSLYSRNGENEDDEYNDEEDDEYNGRRRNILEDDERDNLTMSPAGFPLIYLSLCTWCCSK